MKWACGFCTTAYPTAHAGMFFAILFCQCLSSFVFGQWLSYGSRWCYSVTPPWGAREPGLLLARQDEAQPHWVIHQHPADFLYLRLLTPWSPRVAESELSGFEQSTITSMILWRKTYCQVYCKVCKSDICWIGSKFVKTSKYIKVRRFQIFQASAELRLVAGAPLKNSARGWASLLADVVRRPGAANAIGSSETRRGWNIV